MSMFRMSTFTSILLLLFLFLLAGCGHQNSVPQSDPQWAQRYPGSNFHKIDRAMLSLSAHDQQSLTTLTRAIERVARTDWERVRAVWYWITHNISYDAASRSERKGGIDAQCTFQQKTAVCSGYSRLFVDLARRLGIEVTEISGYVKGEYSYAQAPKISCNHSWVMAKIHGSFHLFDPTWGAGTLINNSFRWQYNENYFDAPPELFVINHLPLNADDQLLDPPLDEASFFRLPYINPTAFAYGLQIQGMLQRARRGASVSAPQFFNCAIAPSFIHVPMRDTLREGQWYRFHLSAPARQMVVRSGGNNPKFIHGENGNFDFSIQVPAGKLVLGMVTNNTQGRIQYSYLLAYDVRP